jgi:hypothetical protein
VVVDGLELVDDIFFYGFLIIVELAFDCMVVENFLLGFRAERVDLFLDEGEIKCFTSVSCH